MPPRKRLSMGKNLQTSPRAHHHRDPQNDADSTSSRNEGYNAAALCCDNSRRQAQRPSIHILPPEVLTEIFILPHINSAGFHYRQIIKVFNPLIICAVCSSWRSLAFSTPQLWQRVFISFPPDLTKIVDEERAAYLVQWIERSRSLPLALHMSFDKKLSTSTGTEAILSVLDDYANRWETLYFQDDDMALRLPLRPSSMEPSAFFQFIIWSYKMFQEICFWGDPDAPVAYPTQDYALVVDESDPTPWEQLTHLQIQDYVCHEDVECILMEFQELVELSILVDTSERLEGPITAHNLVTLSIRRDGTHYPDEQYPLAQLALPCLRNMCIDQVTSQDTQPLFNFLTRSSCTLEKLEIRGLCLTPRDHLDILAHKSCSSLTSLKISELEKPSGVEWHGVLVDDEVLQRLALNRDDTMCPHLKFLTFDGFIECSLSTLLMMVESRVGSCTTELPDEPIHYLHFLRIRSHTGVQKVDEVCKASGMEYTRRRFHIDYLDHYFYSILLRRYNLASKL